MGKKKISRKKRTQSNIIKVKDDFDWRTLRCGDEIKLLQGSGPYCMVTDNSGQPVKEMMSEYGWYTVHSVVKDGIVAYDSYGMHFIYFGPKKVCNITGMIKESHKIGKVKKKNGNDI